MAEAYFLLQIDNGYNFPLQDYGYFFEVGTKEYYASCFFDEGEVAIETGKAEFFTVQEVRNFISEAEINKRTIDALVSHLRIKKKDVKYIYSYDDGYDVEVAIREILESDLNNIMCEYEDIISVVDQKLISEYLPDVYHTVPVNRIGEYIRIEGINALLDSIALDPKITSNMKIIIDELTYLKSCALNTRYTINKLDVTQTEFAKIFCVADKTTVSKWCNAARKPDDFRIRIMDYILNETDENIINYFKKSTIYSAEKVTDPDVINIRRKKIPTL